MINGYMESGSRGFRLVTNGGEPLTNWRKHRQDVFKEYRNKQRKRAKEAR